MPRRTPASRRPTVPRAVIAVVAAALALAAGPAGAQSVAQAPGPEALGFKKSFVVEIVNPSPLALENQAIVIDVAGIRAAVAPDFNTYMYALFDVRDGEYGLVVSQADDLDKDRYHDEIVLVRTLPPSSTTRLVCYYTPERSFQLMPTEKAFARGAWQTGGAEAGWESNLAAYEYVRGGLGFFGKLQAGLVLRGFPAALAKIKDWGALALDPAGAAGLGGLSVWDGAARIPLFGPTAPQARLTVISHGPVRGLVKAEYPAVGTARGGVALTVFFSAFAENVYSRQDVVIDAKEGVPAVLGPALQKLPGEAAALDKARGTLGVWGEGTGKAGKIGLLAVFAPSELSGLDETGSDRAVKLAGRAGQRLTYWLAGAWARGASAPSPADAKGWAARAADLAARLLVPVKIEFKAR